MITRLRFLMLIAVISLVFHAVSFAQVDFIEHPVSPYYNDPWSAVGIDMDGDNDIDVVGSGRLAHNLSWWENVNYEDFVRHNISSGSWYAMVVCVADMDDDTDIDILCASQTNGVELWVNDGEQNFTRQIIGDWPYASYIALANVDSDTDMDVLVACCEGGINRLGWIENEGNLNFTDHIVAADWDHANSVGAGDIDSDGDIDLIGTASYAGEIAWFENDGSQNFTKHVIFTTGARPSCAHADDIDGDGDTDIAAIVCVLNQIMWFENDGSQEFLLHPISPGFFRPHQVRTADFDDDGDIDVLGAAFSSNEIAWWENIGGYPLEWIKHTVSNTFVGATGIEPIDFDLDGDTDILGAAQTGDRITWWENFSTSGVDDNPNSVPDDYIILENYPNPFNASTSINYGIQTSSRILIEIYDLLGCKIETILDRYQTAGYHNLIWNADRLPSGVYFCKVTAGDYSKIGKMLLLK